MASNYFDQLGIVLDLAVEAHAMVRGQAQREVPGVIEERQELDFASVAMIRIVDPIGAKAMNKPQGNYITIDCPALRENQPQVHQQASKLLAQHLGKLLEGALATPEAPVLLVGLGNWQATPDALGPRVIERCVVSRHYYRYAPEDLRPGLREVAALAPGVLGLTGIETAEIIQGVVERIHPAAVICIDALAARNVNRINTTIQLADTGISPGSGVGNQRTNLNLETLGIPVIAIGVPTVVNAAVIAYDTYEGLLAANPGLTVNPQTIHDVVSSLLHPFGGQLTVTPKEIDDLIERTAAVLAGGINWALHPTLSPQELQLYLQ